MSTYNKCFHEEIRQTYEFYIMLVVIISILSSAKSVKMAVMFLSRVSSFLQNN